MELSSHLKIVVHRHIDHPGKWLVTAHEVGIQARTLKNIPQGRRHHATGTGRQVPYHTSLPESHRGRD
jgi:hypothetical protein